MSAEATWHEEPMTGEELPNPDWLAATGDGRAVAASVNALTLEINRLRLTLAADGRMARAWDEGFAAGSARRPRVEVQPRNPYRPRPSGSPGG